MCYPSLNTVWAGGGLNLQYTHQMELWSHVTGIPQRIS